MEESRRQPEDGLAVLPYKANASNVPREEDPKIEIRNQKKLLFIN